jgi:hypothetical protein
MAEKSITQSAFEFINTLFIDKDNRNSILDPLTCIIRLAILCFKPKGTKISLSRNCIKYNNPSLLQGFKRWSMGDNREDLHNIYNPIRKTIEWYDITNNEIKGICEYSIKGIKVLQSSYSSNSIVSHTLDLYINQLEIALTNKSKEPLESIVNRSGDNYNHIYSQLKKLWTENEIIISYNMLLEMTTAQEKNDTKSLESYIASLDSLLDMKEEKVKDIIISTMTVLN